MQRNAVIEVSFSDTQTVSNDVGSASVLTYTAIGGERFFQDDLLIGATVYLVFRDGLVYVVVAGTPDPNAKECNYDTDTGTITFAEGPMPPLQTGEVVTVMYSPGNQELSLTEPVTLAEAKNWCKVDGITDDDTLILELITTSRQICEEITGKSFVQRTITAILKNEQGGILLPYPPHGAVASLKDSLGTAITIDSTTFSGLKQFRLNYKNGSTWNPIRNSDQIDNSNNTFTVIYTAGYAVLPKKYKTALKEEIVWLYTNRGDEDTDRISPVCLSILKQDSVIA